ISYRMSALTRLPSFETRCRRIFGGRALQETLLNILSIPPCEPSTQVIIAAMSSTTPAPDTGTRLAVDRTRLAYERTMMAWIRTATSLISFVFAIYKFFRSDTDRGQGAA